MTEAEEQAISALTQLLQHEIAAIRQGSLDQIGANAARKAELGAAVEAAGPAIADALAADPPDETLIARIATLRELIETDKALLERMTHATGTLVAEVARIRDRHGLRGIYGAKGVQRGAEPVPVQRFDRSV